MKIILSKKQWLSCFLLLLFLPYVQAQKVIIENNNLTENSQTVVKRNFKEQNYTKVNISENKVLYFDQQMSENTVMPSSVTFTIELDFDPLLFQAPWIIMIYNEEGFSDFVFYEGINTIHVELPEGNYDVLATFFNLNSQMSYYIIKEEIDITNNDEVVINPLEANNYISVQAFNEINELLEPGLVDSQIGNTSEVIIERYIYFTPLNTWFDSVFYIQNQPLGGDPYWNFYINNLSERYSIINSFIGLNFGEKQYYPKFPSLSGISESIEVSNNFENWVFHQESFQPSMLTQSQEEVYPGGATATVINDINQGGFVFHTKAYTVNPEQGLKIFLNNPIDEDIANFLVYPTILEYEETINPVWGEEQFFIKGNAIVSTPDGNIQYGSGDTSFGRYFLDADYYMENWEYKTLPFHPKFSFSNISSPDVKIGNNVPAFVSIVDIEPNEYNFFNGQYRGRYGENRESDFFATQIEIKQNGNIVFSGGYMDYLLDYEMPISGEIEIVLENPNIEILGLEGKNVTRITYNASVGDLPPTLQMMQFRDSNGSVRSEFNTSSDGTLMIAAGDFKKEDFGYIYNEGNEIEVNYSIFSEEEWSELELVEYPEHFHMPAFGDYYEASLENVIVPEENSWFDLKIICTDAAGNKQEQIKTVAQFNDTLFSSSILIYF